MIYKLFISGYIVGPWLPQTAKWLMSIVFTLSLSARYESPRLWSSLDNAVKLVFEILGAFAATIKQFVLTGFPTTTTLTVDFAHSFKA